MISRLALWGAAAALATAAELTLAPLATGSPATPSPSITAPAAANALDPDSATLEGSVGRWVPWYSATALRAPEAARTGGAGLRIGVIAPFGWGVTADDWPGFPVVGGAHTVSFWARAGSTGAMGAVATMTVHWKDAVGTDLLVTALPSAPLTDCWHRAEVAVTAPDQAVTAFVTLTGVGRPGDVVYIDDLAIR